jgi:hypothetical protein
MVFHEAINYWIINQFSVVKDLAGAMYYSMTLVVAGKSNCTWRYGAGARSISDNVSQRNVHTTLVRYFCCVVETGGSGTASIADIIFKLFGLTRRLHLRLSDARWEPRAA